MMKFSITSHEYKTFLILYNKKIVILNCNNMYCLFDQTNTAWLSRIFVTFSNSKNNVNMMVSM